MGRSVADTPGAPVATTGALAGLLGRQAHANQRAVKWSCCCVCWCLLVRGVPSERDVAPVRTRRRRSIEQAGAAGRSGQLWGVPAYNFAHPTYAVNAIVCARGLWGDWVQGNNTYPKGAYHESITRHRRGNIRSFAFARPNGGFRGRRRDVYRYGRTSLWCPGSHVRSLP